MFTKYPGNAEAVGPASYLNNQMGIPALLIVSGPGNQKDFWVLELRRGSTKKNPNAGREHSSEVRVQDSANLFLTGQITRRADSADCVVSPTPVQSVRCESRPCRRVARTLQALLPRQVTAQHFKTNMVHATSKSHKTTDYIAATGTLLPGV